MAMDIQYKILFLQYLLRSSVERINISPLHKYNIRVEVSDNSNLFVEITYNDTVVYLKEVNNLSMGELYIKLREITEQLISNQIIKIASDKNTGSIKTTIGRI